MSNHCLSHSFWVSNRYDRCPIYNYYISTIGTLTPLDISPCGTCPPTLWTHNSYVSHVLYRIVFSFFKPLHSSYLLQLYCAISKTTPPRRSPLYLTSVANNKPLYFTTACRLLNVTLPSCFTPSVYTTTYPLGGKVGAMGSIHISTLSNKTSNKKGGGGGWLIGAHIDTSASRLPPSIQLIKDRG